MTAYSDNFGAYGPVYDVQAVVVAAGGSLFVGQDAVLIDEASVSDAVIDADGIASSVSGGAIVFGRPTYSVSDAAGTTIAANTADHAALKAADV
jgi:hypothetical protein